MATHEHTPLLTALRSGAGPSSLGDALDDALARLRDLDGLDDGKADAATTIASEVPSWATSPDVSREGAVTESAVDRLDATTYEEPVTEVMNHAYDPLVLGPNGEPLNPPREPENPPEEDVGTEAVPEVMVDATDTLAMDANGEPANPAGEDASDPEASGPEADAPEASDPEASDPDAFAASAETEDGDFIDTDDADATGSKAFDDALADAPNAGSAVWGDDWADLDVDLDRIQSLAEKLGPKNRTLVADYPPVPPHPDLPKQLSPNQIIVSREQSGLPFDFVPRFPGTLPDPETDGNEVVAAAVANVPGVGFTDKQIELVRANKERNAGLEAGSLTARAMYYAIVDSFNLTNCACGGESLNEYVVQPALNESFTLAASSFSQPIAGVMTNHCLQTEMPEGTYANFDSMTTLHYTVAADREALGDKTAIDTFAKESLAIVHTPDFYTLLQAGILETGMSPDHEGSDVIENGVEFKLLAFIVLEGPPGSAQAVERTNGPVMVPKASGPKASVPEADAPEASDPDAFDDALADALADAPNAGSAVWGDEWADLNVDLDRIQSLAEKLGPKKTMLLADYPPVPPHPDLPKQLSPNQIIVSREQSGLPFDFVPRFPGTLPDPETDGNEVVAAAVANVPGVGFTDKQIELVRANKERNAGLEAGSLTARAMYYAIVDSFNLTNCACGGESLNEYVVQPALNESFTLAASSFSQPIAGVMTNHCLQTEMPEGTYANFDSMTTLHYTVAADREALGDKTAIDTFAKESLAIVHTPDFYTLLQAGILETGVSPDHEGSDVIDSGVAIKLLAFIVLEGPPGTARAVERTNGPVMATTA